MYLCELLKSKYEYKTYKIMYIESSYLIYLRNKII